MNPMYSTCIGLILRGYHDFENGKMRFTGDGGNFMHIQAQVEKPEDTRGEDDEDNELQLEKEVTDSEEQLERYKLKARNRNENVKRLFDGLKGKFMKIFEDVEDEEIG
jgi:cell division protein FtsA